MSQPSEAREGNSVPSDTVVPVWRFEVGSCERQFLYEACVRVQAQHSTDQGGKPVSPLSNDQDWLLMMNITGKISYGIEGNMTEAENIGGYLRKA